MTRMYDRPTLGPDGWVVDETPTPPLPNVTAITDPDTGGIKHFIDPNGRAYARQEVTNYKAGAGELLYAFTDHTAVSAVSGAVLATSSSVQWDGQNTISITTPSAGAACGMSKNGLSTRLRNKSLVVPVYIPDYTKLGKVQVYIAHVAIGTNYAHYTYSLEAASHSLYNGWHLFEVTQDMWTSVGTGITADGSTIAEIRVDIKARAGELSTIYVGAAYLNDRSRSNIIFTFDDGRVSQITNAFPIMEKYNVPGTCYIIPNVINDATAMGESNLSILHDRGWCIANHANHDGIGTDDSYAEIGLSEYVSQVAESAAWLESRGFTGAYHHAYVEGSYDGVLVDALSAIGLKTARTIAGSVTTGAQCMCTNYGVHRRLALTGGMQLNSSYVLATVQAEVDRAIRDGRSLIITAHDIKTTQEGGAGSTSWTTADFETLVAYVAGKRADGLCNTPNIDDWYSRLYIVS